MLAGNFANRTTTSRLDDSFQNLLLEFSSAASQGSDFPALIRLFCRSSRKFLGLDGVYYWSLLPSQELLGIEADGQMAEEFRGSRLTLSDPAVAVEAVRERRTVYVNHLDSARYPMAAHFRALAIMAAPLIVAGEVIGAAVFLSNLSEFFNEDLAAKATILAAHLCSVVEMARLNEAAREERRRAEFLVQCAHLVHSSLDLSQVIHALAERVCELFRAPLVTVLLRQLDRVEMRAAAAPSPELLERLHRAWPGTGYSFAEELVRRAAESDRLLCEPVQPAAGELAALIPSGPVMAAPIRTTRAQGALLVFSGPGRSFTEQDQALLGAIGRFGALAITNAELYAMASNQAAELQQLLDISSELSSTGRLDRFLQQFVVRAAEFLGFSISYIALLEEDGVCRIRWAAREGSGKPMDVSLTSASARRILLTREPFWTDHVASQPEMDHELAQKYGIHQYLAVPLLGSDGRALGLFGVMNRADAAPISPEDVRRAKALSAQVAVALEATQNLHISEEHRKRAENLMGLALELSSSLRLPDFVQSFVVRAADMLGARAAVLALAQEGLLETVAAHGVTLSDRALLRRLSAALTTLAKDRPQPLLTGVPAELLGQAVASALGWQDLVITRLTGADHDLLGLLCLADRDKPLSAEDRNLLQALAGHASVALENSRLFARITQSNKHWMEIFDSITDFIVVHDESHRVLRVNHSLAEFIGVRPSELIGMSVRALVPIAGDAGAQPCPLCRAGAEHADEYIHPVLERTYLVSSSRVRGAANEGMQTIHVLKDITDRREAERRYRELFDTIQEGIYFTTPEGRFVEVNDALVGMLGYETREELLEADIPRHLYPSPEQREAFLQAVEERGLVRNFEETLRRRDGSLVHTLQNAFAVRDAQGRVVQYRGVMLDITELKTFQFQLQRERDFNSKILNSTQSLILAADISGLVTYANRRCFESGAFRQHHLGRPLLELVAPSGRDAMTRAFQATLRGQQVDNLELPLLRSDDRSGQFSVNLSPMRDERGEVTSIIVVMTDVTEAAVLQAKLVHAEKMVAVGQLVSGVAHEVNNPLTAILGFADLLLEQPGLPETAQKDLQVIVQEAQRTKQIVQNLLSFARQTPAQRQPVDLNFILRRTLQLRSYDFSSHGLEVVERLYGNLPEVVGDPHQLQQVFLNILNNAYDAVRESGRPGRIEVETCQSQEFAQVLFRDNGPGIAFPDRIFDPFFTTKEVGKGTGLGLSICYGIVREHGGEITCFNNHGQPGATFIVRLPIVAETETSLAAAGAQA